MVLLELIKIVLMSINLVNTRVALQEQHEFNVGGKQLFTVVKRIEEYVSMFVYCVILYIFYLSWGLYTIYMFVY